MRDASVTRSALIVRACVLLVTSAALGACRDPAARAREEAAERAARDGAMLRTFVSIDQGVDRVLKEADDASRTGDDAQAALLLESKALPSIDSAITFARTAPGETPWGRARHDELASVLNDQRAEIPRYAAALRGTDLDAKLAAVEAQLALQKRAMAAVTAVLVGPGDAAP